MALIKGNNKKIYSNDFLGVDGLNNELEYYILIENEDFQKQFIVDLLLGKNDKFKIIETTEAHITGDYNSDFTDNSANYINIEYVVKIEYKYDSNKKPITFELYFNNDEEININVGDDGMVNDDDNSTVTSIDWSKINVQLRSVEGDMIEFKAFNNAPSNIQKIFVREFIGDFITNETMRLFREF